MAEGTAGGIVGGFTAKRRHTGRLDYAISGDIDKLYEVFSASYDPDLALRAVGGLSMWNPDKTNPERGKLSGIGGRSAFFQSFSAEFRRDEKTYQTLLRSEQHRRSVFNESYFQ